MPHSPATSHPALAALSDGPRTDLAIHLLTGGTVDDRGDHLVVRAPYNPHYHWGTYVRVTTGDPDDVDRWLAVFAHEHPDAGHVAIGLPRAPVPEAVAGRGLEVDVDDALATDVLPELRPLPAGYTARPVVSDDDWEQTVRRELAENARTGRYDPAAHERYARAQVAARRRLAEAGHLAWFGAFEHGTGLLVSDLGIVALGADARYQSVGTDADHRGRGLAGHLLGVAARWAHERGARRFVIVTGATNPAGRLYRRVGFRPVAGDVSLYRPPVR